MACASTIGLLLAGGRGRRLGGQDKAFVRLGGETLLTRMRRRLAPQVDRIAVSSNADPKVYAGTGLEVVTDLKPDYLGPLAGIHAALTRWPQACVLSVAVDLPFVPSDLGARLHAGLADHACAYATDGAHHALAILWAPGQALAVEQFLDAGGRGVGAYLKAHGRPVAFDPAGDADIGFNINTPEDLAAAEARLRGA
jgi:molybdopterin-guanine dinucleotide biosynthesis protein A